MTTGLCSRHYDLQDLTILWKAIRAMKEAVDFGEFLGGVNEVVSRLITDLRQVGYDEKRLRLIIEAGCAQSKYKRLVPSLRFTKRGG